MESVYEQQAAHKAKEYRDAARVSAEARCVAVPRSEIRSCVYEAYDAARHGEHDEYDLQAQLVTSAWTRAMGIAAVIAMGVGIFGVGLIYKTFEETRRGANSGALSAQAARRGVVAAAQANRISQQGQKVQIRPHVHLIGVGHEDGWHDEDGTRFRYINFTLHFRNFGQSPAMTVMLRARAFVGGYSSEDSKFALDEAVTIPLGVIPPGRDVPQDGYSTTYPNDDHQTYLDAAASVFIEGQVHYRDAFGERYHTNFRYVCTGLENIKTLKFRPAPGWNDAS